MSEYIFDVPDSNQPIAGESALYYPDERDEPMAVGEEIVRCRDCVYMCAEYSTVDKHSEVISTGYLCEWTELWTKPDGFSSWAERRDA